MHQQLLWEGDVPHLIANKDPQRGKGKIATLRSECSCRPQRGENVDYSFGTIAREEAWRMQYVREMNITQQEAR
jgi:hypothetical protein